MTANAYRTNAREMYDAGVAAEQREVDEAAQAARGRRRRAVAIASGLCLALSAIPVLLAAAQPNHYVRCHYVHIKYENAPQLPADSYPVCVSR
jgi:hypothetical protein